MRTKLLIIAALFSVSAHAATVSIEHGIFTKHYQHDPRMNESNQFNAIEIRGENHGANASMFNNTYGNDSFTIGGFYNVYDSKYLEIDGMYGIVNGYTQEQLSSVCTGVNCIYVAPRITLKKSISEKVSAKVSAQLFGTAVIVSAGLRYSF